MFTKTINIKTKKQGDMVNLTPQIEDAVREAEIKDGIVHVFAPHATAVFALTELESNLRSDIKDLLEDLIPEKGWSHGLNAHSHLRSMLLPPDKTLPVREGTLIRGTWQDLFFIEADTSGRLREIFITVIGD